MLLRNDEQSVVGLIYDRTVCISLTGLALSKQKPIKQTVVLREINQRDLRTVRMHYV